MFARHLHGAARLAVIVSLLLCALLLPPSASAQSSTLLAQQINAGVGHASAYILTPLTLAYELVNPLFSAAITETTSVQARANLYTQINDVAFVSSVPTAAELTLYPNILTLPYAVIPTVVIFNLPTLNASVPLVLAPQTLSEIFVGQVTWWNDSLIQADNPTVVLPRMPITVVLPNGKYTTSQILLDTLIAQYPPLASYITSSLSPLWPYQAYARYVLTPGIAGPSGAVLTQPYSIGYSLWAIAQLNGNSITAQKNTAGNTITITATTVQLAAIEASTLQIQQVIAATNQQSASRTTLGSTGIELGAAPGQGSWPMLGLEYVVLDTMYSRTTCHARAGLVGFLVWLLTDASAALVLRENMFGAVPSILLSQLDMVDQLETAVMCRGTAAASLNTVASTDVQISVDRYLINSQVLLAQTYNYNVTQAAALAMTSEQLSLSVQSNPSSLVFDQMRFTEVSMGLLFAEQVDSSLYNAYTALEPPQFLLAPLYLVAVAPIYNLQLSDNITLPATVPLNLTAPLILQMLQGNVTSWLDPLVLQLNPFLRATASALPQPQSAPITQIVPCLAGPTSVLYFTRLLTQYPASQDTISSTDNYCANDIPVQPYLQFVTDETKAQAAAQGNVGSFAYTLLTASINAMPTLGVAQLLSNVEQWQQTATGATTNLPFISPTPETLLACVEAGNAADWLTSLPNSTSSSCWPLTTAVVAMLPLTYSTASSSSDCTTGQFIYDYFVTLYNNTDNDNVNYGQWMVRAGVNEPLRQLIDDQVQVVVCDGAALLGARPAVWSLSSSVASFGYALSSVGLVVALAVLVLIAVYLQHAVIAGAQPLLLAVHAAGCAVLLVSVIVMVRTVTTQSCSFLLWAWNVGSTLALAPLYCKVFRWYRMYGHGRRVHRVPNHYLYIALALAITLDIAFTAAWQARAPLLPQLTSRTTSGLETEYVQCGLDAGRVGTGFLVTAAFVKGGALLLFGVMAFTVRRVLISYKENVSVAYSLYNTAFALLLLVPITTLITAIGDVLIALLAILVLWVAITPLLLLFAPKAAILLGVTDGGHNSVNPVLSSAKSVSLGFSFLPVGAMSDDVLECYIKAVEAQVADAKRRMGGGGKVDGENDEASDAEEDGVQQSTGKRFGVNGSPMDVRRRASSSNASSGRASPVHASRSHASTNRVPGQRL